ncbi:GNAT family N-acetyltransferase [Streptomyces sp. I05A-00742]|uniref:GNAT family N-acetyltransferase n=1 Tax=Streptomyces sp. I05A-00742 TaxID=2732853 RepID=UPI0014882D84|nr:GNAT family N-acetyltransferase [Streptomyces sp. I05A-00742]
MTTTPLATPCTPPLAITPHPVTAPESAALLRAYLTDVADRWYLLHHGRTTTPEEIDGLLATEQSSGHLVPPDAVFLLARREDEPAGCAGLRRLDARTAEVTRMYVRPAHRGAGTAPALLEALEETARGWGVARVVLETRRDLTEARALYARHGYADIEPYVHGPYSEVWLGKSLGRGH